MGLDMYLKAKRHVGGFDFLPEPEKEAYKAIIDMVKAEPLVDSEAPYLDVAVTAMYWRKANAIHGWFVRNVQDGEDECREHYVPRATLIELQKDIMTVLENKDKAMELLPPTEGFFFGNYQIDDYYWDYLRQTAFNIEKLLKLASNDWEFYYRSSW